MAGPTVRHGNLFLSTGSMPRGPCRTGLLWRLLVTLSRGAEEEIDVPPSSRKDRGRTKASDPKGRVRRGRPKVCVFCTEHIPWVDYKDMNLLRRFMSDRGKIKSRANTGTCSQHQADVALAIKNARELALLPYAVRTLAGDKSAGRRGRGGPGGRPDRPSVPMAPPSAGSGDAGPTGEASESAADETPSLASEPAETALSTIDSTESTATSTDDEVQG
jgi:small subunit ribosomal protein S18